MTVRANTLSRRSFCLCCVAASGVAAGGAWLTPAEAFAEAQNLVDVFRDDAAKAKAITQPLRGGVSVLLGSGGNIGVITGPDGKVFIDAGITGSRPRILAAAAALSDGPITTLINTHWHFDHTDGNQWLAMEGASIIGHANTHKHLLEAQRVADWDFTFPSSPLAAAPTDVVTDERTMSLNGKTLHLKHYGPAHTDSDLSVMIEEADVLHCGDTFWNGLYPFIDYSTGGSIDGMIAATEANIAAAGEQTIVVCGHGNPDGTRADLVAYRDMLARIRDNVARLKAAGRSPDEAVAARPTADFDATYGWPVITPAFFTRLVYQGV